MNEKMINDLKEIYNLHNDINSGGCAKVAINISKKYNLKPVIIHKHGYGIFHVMITDGVYYYDANQNPVNTYGDLVCRFGLFNILDTTIKELNEIDFIGHLKYN